MTREIPATKLCSICREHRPLTQFSKNRHMRDGLTYECKPCAREKVAAWKRAHPGAWTMWYQRNRDKVRLRQKNYRAANRAHYNEQNRCWVAANRGKKRALVMQRYTSKLHATPRWTDLSAVEMFYQEAHRLTRETGIKHNVDHIVPLKSSLVCGLHVPWNLQVITASENRAKSNQLNPSGPVPCPLPLPY